MVKNVRICPQFLERVFFTGRSNFLDMPVFFWHSVVSNLHYSFRSKAETINVFWFFKKKIFWKKVGVRRTGKIKSPQNAKNDEKTLDFWRCFLAREARRKIWHYSNLEKSTGTCAEALMQSLNNCQPAIAGMQTLGHIAELSRGGIIAEKQLTGVQAALRAKLTLPRGTLRLG